MRAAERSSVRRLLREEAFSERLSPRLVEWAFVLPFTATVGLAFAALHPPLFHALVVEDGPLEWAGTAAYTAAFLVAALLAVRLIRAGRHAYAAGAFLLSLGCLFVVGEEISWGQRLGGWETPAGLRSANVQEETTVHNVSGVDEGFRAALVAVGLYGSCAWLVARRRARRKELLVLAPPLFLASLFLVPFVYLRRPARRAPVAELRRREVQRAPRAPGRLGPARRPRSLLAAAARGRPA